MTAPKDFVLVGDKVRHIKYPKQHMDDLHKITQHVKVQNETQLLSQRFNACGCLPNSLYLYNIFYAPHLGHDMLPFFFLGGGVGGDAAEMDTSPKNTHITDMTPKTPQQS